MKSLISDQMTRREFLKTNATLFLTLGMAPYLPGCADHDQDEVGSLINSVTLNPYNGTTIGAAYLLYQDSLSNRKTAFDPEKLIKLCTATSKSWEQEIITTTNRARRTEDDFSLGIAATFKGKMFGGALAVSNAYNRSNSQIEMVNDLTWNSRATRTGDIWIINWAEYSYSLFYGSLTKEAQGKLKDIFDHYNRTVQLIKNYEITTPKGVETAKQYRDRVTRWYNQYGYGFVSGLWVGMLGKADLTISSKATNTTTRWNNTSSISYTSPKKGAGLNVAVDNLSADYSSQASGNVVIQVMPANVDMIKWKDSWKEKFVGKLDSISDIMKIDPSPSVYGKTIDPPDIEIPTDKVDRDVSSKFSVTDLESAKSCALVIDWEKNRKKGETIDEYKSRRDNEKAEEARKFEGRQEGGEFNDEIVEEIIGGDDNGRLRLVGTDDSLAPEAEPDVIQHNSATPWAEFMSNWTTLGVYITRWADVIPQLTMAEAISSKKASLHGGLVYLWAVRYQTELTRFADYIDLCLPYAKSFAWKQQATNIQSFGNQVRNFASDFKREITKRLDIAKDDPKYTCINFYEELKTIKTKQQNKMSFPAMFACWSKNYDFFKQADFGCGLAMMPEGFGKDAPQLFLVGPHRPTCYEYDYAYEVNWLLTSFDSRDYVRQPELFANLAKVLPLITDDGKIMFLMIGSGREEGWDAYGMLDAFMMMRNSNNYEHSESFTVGSLGVVENESKYFLAADVGQRVYDLFNWYYDKGSVRWWTKRIYKDPGTEDSIYLMGRSAVGRCGENDYLANTNCSDLTSFYLVPLGGFAEGTSVRGVKISREMPDCIANPFNLYTSQTVEELLEDMSSAVYENIPPASTEDIMSSSLNDHRIWKGILPDPDV